MKNSNTLRGGKEGISITKLDIARVGRAEVLQVKAQPAPLPSLTLNVFVIWIFIYFKSKSMQVILTHVNLFNRKGIWD